VKYEGNSESNSSRSCKLCCVSTFKGVGSVDDVVVVVFGAPIAIAVDAEIDSRGCWIEALGGASRMFVFVSSYFSIISVIRTFSS